jgi:hypothetical protein
MSYRRMHLEKPGAARVQHPSGIMQYTARCGQTVYAVQPDERLVSCKRCLESAYKQRMRTLPGPPANNP